MAAGAAADAAVSLTGPKDTHMHLRPRSFVAPNASPMTMEGTITYVVGQSTIAIIDPGSDDPAHLDRLAEVAAGARRTVIIVTHAHPDHSTGALELADRTGAALLGGHAGRTGGKAAAQDQKPQSGAQSAVRTGKGEASRAAGGGLLADGVSVTTDEGDLIVMRTPGHAPDHISLHWPDASAIFCGDLMMGGLDTAVVAAPEGDIEAYLRSLERLRALRPSVIYPAHGPPFTDPDEAIDRYIHHREERLEQVIAALDAGDEDAGSIADRIYGASMDPSLRPFAEAAVEAYLNHLRGQGRIKP
ncbi:MAG TPA: MBL fold metallo-hydrolase [Longimicrobiales bacterium]|nr:MBL fold metallo-hydrolase [Longimicrobiales bacterium]